MHWVRFWSRRGTLLALAYAAAASAWILVVELELVAGDHLAASPSILKGLAFVAFTAVALGITLTRTGSRIDANARALDQARAVADLGASVDRTLLMGGGLSVALHQVCDGLVELTGAVAVWVVRSGEGNGESNGGPQIDVAACSCGAQCRDPLAEHFLSNGPAQTASELTGEGLSWRAVTGGRAVSLGAGDGPLDPWLEGIGGLGDVLVVPVPVPDGEDLPVGAVGVAVPEGAHLGEGLRSLVEAMAARLALAFQVVEHQNQLVLLESAARAAGSAIAICDGPGRLVWVNDSYLTLTGYQRHELLGDDARFLIPEAVREQLVEKVTARLRERRPFIGESNIIRKDGILVPARHLMTPLLGEAGQLEHVVMIHEDLSERREAEARLAWQSSHDPATGLGNRKDLVERLRLVTAAIDTNSDLGHGAVAVLKVDGLARVYELLGSAARDELTVAVARRLEPVVDDLDVLARLDGDCFAVLISSLTGPQAAVITVERLQESLRAPFWVGGEAMYLSACVGVGLYPDDTSDADELVNYAAIAARRAHDAGPGQLRFHTEGDNQESVEVLRLHGALHEGLARQQFVLHYQPQVDLRSGAVVGIEALVRWQHPELGLVPPNRFISAAESNGLIVPLTAWTLREATEVCRQLRASVAPGLRIAVNISPVYLSSGGVPELVEAVLADVGLEPEFLELELVESGVLASEGVSGELEALTALGVRLAVDEFGTGYSSLTHLRELALSVVKLDREFVAGLPEDSANVAIVGGVVSIAHDLGREVLAEGVETDAELAAVHTLGFDLAQGFGIARPMPRGDLERYLAARSPALWRT